jgi:hypothetical protein
MELKKAGRTELEGINLDIGALEVLKPKLVLQAILIKNVLGL